MTYEGCYANEFRICYGASYRARFSITFLSLNGDFSLNFSQDKQMKQDNRICVASDSCGHAHWLWVSRTQLPLV